MKKVTFIFHSSFMVELNRVVLIFDYYGEGTLPQIPPNKQVYFLASHGHQDHFDKKILSYREQIPDTEFILSSDIPQKTEEQKPWIHRVKRDQEYIVGPLKIRTLRSTDQGVAFVIETEEVRIYHGGDLNWWHWEGEDKAWNNNMAANYKREIQKIQGEHFHLAFVVLDPRQEEAYRWGMDYFLDHTENDHIFPMHCWQNYDLARQYQKELEKQGSVSLAKKLCCPRYPGQVWENL